MSEVASRLARDLPAACCQRPYLPEHCTLIPQYAIHQITGHVPSHADLESRRFCRQPRGNGSESATTAWQSDSLKEAGHECH